MQRLTITVDDELIGEIDHFIEKRGYQNRSEAFRDFARTALQRAYEESEERSNCVAALVYSFDHAIRDLPNRLAEIQHDHHDLSFASTRVQLDHENCFEVSLLRGQMKDIRRLAANITAERGVRHGQLVVIPVEVSLEKHAHGSRAAHQHSHIRVREAGSD
jgi:CopG family transcriptional regulator, nickel-responsive regulator